jgi:hypothetical protein
MYCRYLFSSLLEALPGTTWILRDIDHNVKEGTYVSEVEEHLLYTKSLMVIHLFKYFLCTRAGLRKKAAIKVSMVLQYTLELYYCIAVYIGKVFNLVIWQFLS